jgi:carbonic anhydrase
MCELCQPPRPHLSRRSVMTGAAALLAAGALPFSHACAEEPASNGPAPNAIPPAEALDLLMQGNARYAANEPRERDFSAGRAARAKSQYPIAAVLGCSDSRVAPDLVFDHGPGDIFVVRVAGNVVDDNGLASLEYAVEFLGVPLVMVLGHTNCGAVGAAIQAVTSRKELPGHLPELIKAIEPAVIAAHARHPGDFLAAATEENVRLNIKRLPERSEVLGRALSAQKIALSGGIYDLATGKVKLN